MPVAAGFAGVHARALIMAMVDLVLARQRLQKGDSVVGGRLFLMCHGWSIFLPHMVSQPSWPESTLTAWLWDPRRHSYSVWFKIVGGRILMPRL